MDNRRPKNRGSFRPIILCSAFTLLEIVLAMALSTVVLYLLMTATELYLYRVDSSRGRVESAQLARTLLGKIADDLQSARYVGPKTTTPDAGSLGSPSANASAGAGTTDATPADSSAGGATSGTPTGGVNNTPVVSGPINILGVYGNLEELRIDRTPAANWDRPTLEDDQETVFRPRNLSQTVRYFFEKGDRLSAAEFASQGVSEEPLTVAAGLYRHQTPTAALPIDDADAVEQGLQKEQAELLAPEVISIEFAYYDGVELLDEWDTAQQQGLPQGVEIRLQLLQTSYENALDQQTRDSTNSATGYRERDVVEYRRFVSLAPIRPQPPTPIAGGNQGGGGNGQGETGDSPSESGDNSAGDDSAGDGAAAGGSGADE